MKAPGTVDIRKWVEEHRALMPRPLMSHDKIWNDGFFVNLFDGPTADERADFHINGSPEFFVQLLGEMHCRVVQDGRFEDFVVHEGEMFLLPPSIPHRNRRGAGSFGLVVHQQRAPGATDAILWYCEKCCHQLYRVDYVLDDLREQLTTYVRQFLSDERKRTCEKCGWVMPANQGVM